jgi:hypothetical protein
VNDSTESEFLVLIEAQRRIKRGRNKNKFELLIGNAGSRFIARISNRLHQPTAIVVLRILLLLGAAASAQRQALRSPTIRTDQRPVAR